MIQEGPIQKGTVREGTVLEAVIPEGAGHVERIRRERTGRVWMGALDPIEMRWRGGWRELWLGSSIRRVFT
ncbi:hypothetical protein RRSWK_07127 [Rhodopirellula sp. SWK7]|nr:hypothetical protein RRSWK_07127 [Rhodopirellula sp. SWK7]